MRRRLQGHSTALTLSLWTSFFIRSLSFCALASLCRSERSFRSRLRVNAAGDADSLILDDTRALALSDITKASLSGRDGGTLSGTLKVTSFTWLPAASSAGATPGGSEQSERTREGLGWGLDCLFSSEGLRFLGDRGPLEGSGPGVWLPGVGSSLAVESWASTGV